MATQDAPIHRRPYRLRTAELEGDGRASTVGLCGLIQESANLHAHELGASLEHLATQNLTWFLSRLQLRFEGRPSWRETVTVETWPSAIESLFAVRDFRWFGENGNVLGLGTSHWILIDTNRRRPIRRLPPFLLEVHPKKSFRALPEEPGRWSDSWSSPASWVEEAHLRVRRSDLDLNRHLNSVTQIEMLLEATPEDHFGKGMSELVVEFKSEGHLGERLLARSGPTEDTEIWSFELAEESTGRLVARAKVHG